MIRSILLIFVGVSITAFFSFWAVAFSLLGAGENRIHRLAQLWARMLLALSSIPVEISGLRHVLLDRPQIFAANHQSDIDTLVALACIPVQFRWIAKQELFSIPLFGTAMRNAGYIPIDRRNHDSALRSLENAAQIIRRGRSVMTFPEGTRSGDGTIQPFKQGVFHLAISAGVPVVPVTIIGSGAIMQGVLRAQELLAEKFRVSSDVWSATSYQQLRNEALSADRWNRLHPESPPRVPYVAEVLDGARGPFVAATDFMKALPEMIRPWLPGRLVALGTDGYGRSDTREALRRFFEVDAESIVIAALHALAQEGAIPPARVAEAIRDLGVDPDKPDPIDCG